MLINSRKIGRWVKHYKQTCVQLSEPVLSSLDILWTECSCPGCDCSSLLGTSCGCFLWEPFSPGVFLLQLYQSCISPAFTLKYSFLQLFFFFHIFYSCVISDNVTSLNFIQLVIPVCFQPDGHLSIFYLLQGISSLGNGQCSPVSSIYCM